MPSSSDWSGHAGRVTLPVFRGSALFPWVGGGRGATALPLFSSRWRVLDATSRRAIASRKAVPADVKEPFPFSWSSGTRMIIPHSLCRKQAGIAVFGNRARLRPNNVLAHTGKTLRTVVAMTASCTCPMRVHTIATTAGNARLQTSPVVDRLAANSSYVQ